jgi:hypothetical protein
MPRNVLVDVAAEQARVDVVAARWRIADDEVDGFAGVELFRRLRAGGRASGTDHARDCGSGQADVSNSFHCCFLPIIICPPSPDKKRRTIAED